MTPSRRIAALLLLALALAPAVNAQRTIPWWAADASGAAQGVQTLQALYSSTGQPAVGLSNGSGRILGSGYLFIRIVPSGAPTIVGQAAVDFGSVIVGSNVARSYTVQNGGAAPLVISGMTIAPAVFSIQSGGGPQTIPAGGSVTMQLLFAPAAAGAASGQLVITSNASNAPTFTVTLAGTGTASAPVIALSATTLDFGAVATGSSSVRSVTVSNTGNAPLAISGQSVAGTDAALYTITHNASTPIAAGNSDYIELRFAPTSAGVKTATLTITSNDPNHASVTVFLSGSGTTTTQPHIALSATTIDFGTASVGGTVQRDLVISNTGTATLTISGQNVSGAMFSLTQPAGGAIAPAGTSTARLTFAPTAAGTYTGAFDIASNDPAAPTVTVQLRGTCGTVTGPRIAFSSSVLDFGNVAVMSPKELDLTVRNIGTSDLIISGQSIAGTNALDFSIAQAAGSPIAPTGSSIVRVRHLPLSAGSKMALLRIASNDPGSPTSEVVLISTATGVDRLPAAPDGIRLHQNYPNPFNPSTTIEYETDEAGAVRLAVFDATGRTVAVLDNEARTAGSYRVTWDATAVASGVYTAELRVTTARGAVVERIVMLCAK
jgi:hypothetical protein